MFLNLSNFKTYGLQLKEIPSQLEFSELHPYILKLQAEKCGVDKSHATLFLCEILLGGPESPWNFSVAWTRAWNFRKLNSNFAAAAASPSPSAFLQLQFSSQLFLLGF